MRHGRFLEYAGDLTENYIGVDVVRHPGLSEDAAFYRADLDRESIPVATASADIVAALETIEHLETRACFSASWCGFSSRAAGWS